MRARPVVNVRTWRLLGDAVPVPKPKPAADPTPPPSAPAPGVLGPELRPGALSIWVVALQQTLGVSPTSGYFGPLTEAAVKDLQSGSNLPATGVVTAATWNLLGGVTAPAVDPTRTAAARDSAQHRKDLGVAAFVASWTASAVVDRESGGNCAIVSYNGAWRGKWQMDASFWATYGGTEFAAAPEAATCAQQDLVAYNGWVDRWWWPWKKEAFPQ
ncbi:MAG: peptidoglycan-binding protein [Actinomycetia bacterium]|nr:peptidoglycan-binding protein [Actinomycetes bacterium]MCH9802112.1 peptidoglycan-binding protein [Actinomycetes bacterium]